VGEKKNNFKENYYSYNKIETFRKISKVDSNRDRVTRGSEVVHSWHDRAIAVPRVLSKYINFLAEHAVACSLITNCEQTCLQNLCPNSFIFLSLKVVLSPKSGLGLVIWVEKKGHI